MSPVTGRVRNGTTNQPATNVQVQYIQLQQGMTPLGAVTTDREGRFAFDKFPNAGGSPALLRVEYQGATYSQPLMAPQAPASGVEILVYEASRESSAIAVREHALFLHPTGEELAVIEQVFLENRSSPPRTYVNPEGTYLFTLPGKPREDVRVTVEGAAGMPISQTPTPMERENSYAISYPMRPGETSLRVEYSLDYQSPFNLSKSLDRPAEQTHIVIPGEGVEVTGENLIPAGNDPASGFTAYRVTPVANVVKVEISGQAPIRSSAEAPTGEGGLITIPDPVGERRWIVLAALGLVMLAGFVYLYTR